MENIKHIACWAGIIGALLVACKICVWGYVFFVVSSFCWVSYGNSSKDSDIILMNMVFLFINFLGLYNWYIT